MYYIYVQKAKQEYLAALKQCFANPLAVFDERVTGFVIGPFFSVAHYQEYEWNRRITSECNRAYGFVKDCGGELEVRFLRGKGMLSPSWLLIWTAVCRVIFLMTELRMQYAMGWSAWLFSLICAFIVCGVSAVEALLTEKGIAGAYEIDKLLEDPEKYHC